jgi:IS30 family transposase
VDDLPDPAGTESPAGRAYLWQYKQVWMHHETVYQWLYADKAVGGRLYKHLRIVSKPYRKRYGSYDSRGKIKSRVDIDERPAIVETRTRLGDWEGDTVIGEGSDRVITRYFLGVQSLG